MPKFTRIEIFKTVIGSHMWGMQTPESDIDYFTGFVYPTKILLMGYHPKMSFFYPGQGVDEHQHEIEKIISQLLKGNINFIFGVMSPVVVKSSPYFRELREIVAKHPPKNIYHSVRGLAVHNYKKYIETGSDTSERRVNKILRVLQFGITLLKTGRYEFKPYYGGTPRLVIQKIKELDEAYKNSKIEESIPEEVLRKYLYKVRIDFLKEMI